MRSLMILAPIALLAACASTGSTQSPSGGAEPSPEISGTAWQIVSVDGQNAAGARTPTMKFADGRISGNSGCNSYSGPYSLTDGQLTLGPVISTKMACVGDGMDTEARLFAALKGALSVAQRSADRLSLSSDGHSIELRRAE